MRFFVTIPALLAALAIATPTPKALEARQSEEELGDDAIDPMEPHLTTVQQCTFVKRYEAIYVFNVAIRNADDHTRDECGSGFLDNLHGHGCTVTQWGCNYDDSDSSGGRVANMNFQSDLGCEKGDVQAAIYKAFGSLEGVECHDHDQFPGTGLPISPPPPGK